MENSLLDRLRARDASAFQETMLRYAGPLHRLTARLLRDRTEAEDVVQESFARLFLNIDAVKAVRPWLFQVAVNIARTLGRRRALADRTPPPSPPADPAPSTGLAELVDEALERLPEKSRTAFMLREIGGLTTEEVAEAEGCSPEAVRQRLTEARRKLREALGPHLHSNHFQGV